MNTIKTFLISPSCYYPQTKTQTNQPASSHQRNFTGKKEVHNFRSDTLKAMMGLSFKGGIKEVSFEDISQAIDQAQYFNYENFTVSKDAQPVISFYKDDDEFRVGELGIFIFKDGKNKPSSSCDIAIGRDSEHKLLEKALKRAKSYIADVYKDLGLTENLNTEDVLRYLTEKTLDNSIKWEHVETGWKTQCLTNMTYINARKAEFEFNGRKTTVTLMSESFNPHHLLLIQQEGAPKNTFGIECKSDKEKQAAYRLSQAIIG